MKARSLPPVMLNRKLHERWVLLGCLALSGCDAPQQSGSTPPATTGPAPSAAVFVAFDTTAVCQASVGQGQQWAPIDINTLVESPLTVFEEQGTTWSTSHRVTGAAWLEVAAAQPCLLPGWSPENLPLDPAAPVFVWLGAPGCERIDPILGSSHDVVDEGYRITAVLPVRVQAGADARIVDAVRMQTEDTAHRLTLDRADLERCVHAEPRPGEDSAVRLRAVALPVSGTFGPSPLVMSAERGEGPPVPLSVAPLLRGASRAVRTAFEARTWQSQARAVTWGEGPAMELQVRTEVLRRDAVDANLEPTGPVPEPGHERLRARVEAERVAVAWAELEARYPGPEGQSYLSSAQSRLRRGDAELQTLPAMHPTPPLLRSLPERVSVDSVTTVSGFALASRFEVEGWVAADRGTRQDNRALARHVAARLRRLADLTAVVQRHAAGEVDAAHAGAGPAAGLTVTAAMLLDAPVALIAGWRQGSPSSGVTAMPMTLPQGRACVVLAAEALTGGESEPVLLEVGIAGEGAFTPLAADLRGVSRPAFIACGLPTDLGLTVRVVADVPFAVGMFAYGEDVTAGHVLASTLARTPLVTAGASLDGGLGLPEPVELSTSAAEAQRFRLTFEGNETP